MKCTNRWLGLLGISVLLLVGGCQSGALEGDLGQIADTDPGTPPSDGQGASDVPVETAEAPEVSAELPDDVPVEEGCEPGSGCFGEPCEGGEDCLSGYCGWHLGETVCTRTCEESCPAGWSCTLVQSGGTDATYLCVSDHSHLCRPCANSQGCSGDGATVACIRYPDEGSFCGASCGGDSDCPEGFLCDGVETVDGGTSDQCVAAAGVCACSETAVTLGLSTPCQITNEAGACAGLRQCGPSGLEDCDAQIPEEELCNGLDDDCDGETDEDTCGDGNPCTVDSCEPGVGCEHEPLSAIPCNDNDACSTSDHCLEGACVGESVQCSDGNPCTDDLCDEVFGCSFPNGQGSCSDGNPCTLGDHCVDGACVSGPEVQCDDQNPCTEDFCDDLEGCGHTPAIGPCDDQNPCTVGDSCKDGFCKSSSLADCDDQNPCTVDLCDVTAGCEHLEVTQPCDDGDACTLEDICAEGVCTGGGTTDCDDSNPCTTDSCHTVLGCQHVPNSLSCDDGNPCTVDDFCAAGVCLATIAADCDDGNPCTTDSCLPAGGCSQTPNGQSCDDADPCTLGDHCVGANCLGGQGKLSCNDGNPCTDDSCQAGQGCAFAPNAAPCEDQNACTIDDHCSDGACVGAGTLLCDDGNPCTLDLCLPGSGCQHEAIDGPCSDADPCTLGDACAQGACQPGFYQDCDDQNPCTADECTTDGTCAHVPAEGPCSDSNPCSEGDHCEGGQCVSSASLVCDDQNPCTDDGCDPAVGCTHADSDSPCQDGDACTVGDQCVGGACQTGDDLVCDDGNPCTDASCDPGTGCVFTPNESPCDDHNACSTGETCNGGACVATASLVCGDENPCTDSVCDPVTGCAQVPNEALCDDQDACTVGDHCGAGECTPGTPVTCDDGNVCTDDICNPSAGCTFTHNQDPCDDGNACTTGDACADGWCLSEATLDCDDVEPCTVESCVPETGCVQTAAADGTLCGDLLNDTCNGGACMCVPNCVVNGCGDDGCGGSCGECNGQNACLNGICVCQPACDGKDCGADGCGGDCGACPDGSICENNACTAFACGESGVNIDNGCIWTAPGADTLLTPQGVSSFSVTMIGGGGGAGSSYYYPGGGGGSGYYVINETYDVTPGDPIQVQVGSGGEDQGDGNPSLFGSLTVAGGKRGNDHGAPSGQANARGGDGGSGGGAGYTNSGDGGGIGSGVPMGAYAGDPGQPSANSSNPAFQGEGYGAGGGAPSGTSGYSSDCGGNNGVGGFNGGNGQTMGGCGGGGGGAGGLIVPGAAEAGSVQHTFGKNGAVWITLQ